ncbi:MAG: hypothetical protein PHG40_04675 [Candidatus Omnitrophica bacterium]|nr:hypothetical protein [Candidatus Omnitrophota bacterium]
MPENEKITYGIDPYNRIILPRFRTIIDGEFKVSKNNVLTYRVKKPSSSPLQELKLSGNWSLDKNHNLVLTLDKENNQRKGDRLTLEGEIIDASGNELVFSLATKYAGGKTHFYLIRLEGKWQADRYNRLGFLVTKDSGLPDELTLTGSWEINRKNQIIYSYTKSVLKTRTKLTRSLIFKGSWDISERNRLSYTLDKGTDSGFAFKVALGKPAKKGMQYELGVGREGAKKRYLIFGSWKINERLGLIFEMPGAGQKSRDFVFGANCRLDKNSNLELRLKDARQKDLGMEIKLSRNFLNGVGSEYIEALKQGEEISLIAGMGFRW